jgi:glyoxylase-like metal-dependent hydrolase (beta-lactamase superfamily II)
VCLFQPERRLLISGDHLLGRISLYFDYGYSPDPVGEFVRSLDVVERLGARLCLPGHGRTFTDVHAHIEGNRDLVRRRTERVLGAIAPAPRTAFEIVPEIYDDVPFSAFTAPWLLTETLSFLLHLEVTGRARRIPGEPERWTPLESPREEPGEPEREAPSEP